jgi:superfamily II DNA or RNA helicase
LGSALRITTFTPVLTHGLRREELVWQAQAQCARCGLRAGVEMRDHRSAASDDVVVASVQTVGARRSGASGGRGGLERLQQYVHAPPAIVIVDEVSRPRFDTLFWLS